MRNLIRYFQLFVTLVLFVNIGLANNPPTSSGSSNPIMHTFYASSNGSGSDCTLNHPGSLTSVRDKIRTVNGNMTGDIVVKLLGGTYQLSSTFALDAQDSGSNGFNVVYEAKDTLSPPVFSGGKQISGWTLHDASRNIYKAYAGTNEFRQLYINGTMGTRARKPNLTNLQDFGSYYKSNISVNTSNNKVTVSKDKIGNWERLNQVELVMMPHWYHYRLLIESITTNGTQATITPRNSEKKTFNKGTGFYSTSFYYFENAYEFLDFEGEWYLNTDNDTLYYKPRYYENMASLEIIAPGDIETLMTISGTIDNPVHNIQIHNIRFEYTTWMIPSAKGTAATQGNQLLKDFRNAAKDRTPAPTLMVEYANNLRFERNVFSKAGGVGVDFHRSVKNSQFVGNVLYDIAGNGIVLDLKNRRNPPAEMQSNMLIANNYIDRVGRNYSNGIGIFVGYVKNIIIEHNEITNSRYMGMQIGNQSNGNIDVGMGNNLIRYNNVHHVMQSHDDGGAIYTLSRQPGTHIFENWLHHVKKSVWASNWPVAAEYQDNYSESIKIERNVMHNNSKNIYQQTRIGARNNTYIANNIQDQSVKDNAGLELAYRNIKDIVPPLPLLPSSITSPDNLRATATSAAEVNLSWRDKSNNETGFKVQRSLNGTSGWSNITTTAANATSFSNTGLSASTKYYYRVRATNASGNSAYSNIANVTTNSGSGHTSRLSPVEDAYVRDGSFAGSNYGTDISLVVKASPAIKYSRRSYLKFDLSAYATKTVQSAVLRLHVKATNASPVVHVNVSGLAGDTWTETGIRWNNQPTAGGVNIGAINVSNTGEYSINVTDFIKSQLSDSKATFCLKDIENKNKVVSFHSRESSNQPELVIVTEGGTSTPVAPAAPGSLSATATSATQVNLSWGDNSDNETGFKVQRSLNGTSGWSNITTTAANTTSFSNTGLSASTRYYYRVCATNATGNSGFGNIANATTSAPPAQDWCSTHAWKANKAYVKGNKVSYNGKKYVAKWWTKGQNPSSTGKWGVWKLIGTCGGLKSATVNTLEGPAVARGNTVNAYPNPFTNRTRIIFNLYEGSHVVVTVHNNTGRAIRTLLNVNLNTGIHSVDFDATGLPAGLYIYKAIINNKIQTGKIVKE